jgi:hypothetical protein
MCPLISYHYTLSLFIVNNILIDLNIILVYSLHSLFNNICSLYTETFKDVEHVNISYVKFGLQRVNNRGSIHGTFSLSSDPGFMPFLQDKFVFYF